MKSIMEMLMKPTQLNPDQERQFQAWQALHNVPQSHDYDMRGFFLASQDPASGLNSSINPNDGQMHFPDAYKLPNHRTFSTDSRFYDALTMPNTPSWAGGSFGAREGDEAWALRRPNGEVVEQESPIFRRVYGRD